MPWRQLLLESHAIAVLSATGVGLLAFPGADLAKSAQPALARIVAPTEMTADPVAAEPKGPQARLHGARQSVEPEPDLVRASDGRATAPSRAEDAKPPADRRAFEGCLNAHEQEACRRAFEAAIARQGGFVLAPAGSRLGTQPIEPLPSLDFEDGPQWRRTLESLSEEGITFKRLRRGNEHELSFGISRDGVLGFTLSERSDSDR